MIRTLPKVEALKAEIAQRMMDEIRQRLDWQPVKFAEWLASYTYEDACRIAEAEVDAKTVVGVDGGGMGTCSFCGGRLDFKFIVRFADGTSIDRCGLHTNTDI